MQATMLGGLSSEHKEERNAKYARLMLLSRLINWAMLCLQLTRVRLSVSLT